MQFHQIIKNEVKNQSHVQVQRLELEEFQKILNIFDGYRMLQKMMGNLNV
jgi:hypothetical protein